MSISKDFAEIISSAGKKGTQPYTTKAKVTRVDGDTAYVHLEDGVPETPVALSINANEGDDVLVRIANSGGYIVGNTSAPPTDDSLAKVGLTESANAKQMATSAKDAADIAWKHADSANIAAISAQNSALQAQASALEAKGSATTANNAATDALFQLSEVESVLDTLNWITEHGYYQATADTTVAAYKVYYTLTGVVVTNPVGSPAMNKYYELVNGKYVKSSDTTVAAGKTYYQVVQTPVQNPASNPSVAGYYELAIDQSLESYVSTHLAVTDSGLWIIPDGTPDSPVTKVLVSASGPNAGITLYGTSGQPLAHYGAYSLIGDPSKSNIKISDEKVAFCQGADEIAYVSGQELYITRTVVLDRMQLNNKWVWQYDSEDDGIFLKWIG